MFVWTQPRRMLVLAVLYARAKGVSGPAEGVTAQGLVWQAGFGPECDAVADRLHHYMDQKGLWEGRTGIVDGAPAPVMRLTPAGVDAVETFSQEMGLNLLELASDGRLRLLRELWELAGGHVAKLVDPDKAAAAAYSDLGGVPASLNHLSALGLVTLHSDGRSPKTVALTQAGVDLVTNGDLPRTASPPSGVTISISGNNNGVVNTGSIGDSDIVSSTAPIPSPSTPRFHEEAGLARWWHRPVKVALAVVLGCVCVWAALRFGVLAWLSDEHHPARPVVEGLSWLAGIGAFPLGVVVLILQLRSNKPSPEPPAADLERSATQSTGDHGANLSGGVHNHGSGPTFGIVQGSVNFNQAPPDPPDPTRE